MIKYDLICAQGHEFDGWFADSAAYDKLAERGLLSCSQCGSSKVEKQLMAPGIPAKSNRKAEVPAKMVAGGMAPDAAKMLEMMREYRKAVVANSEDVGDRFAEEARKMHYNESEKRGIYGEAKPDEAAGPVGRRHRSVSRCHACRKTAIDVAASASLTFVFCFDPNLPAVHGGRCR